MEQKNNKFLFFLFVALTIVNLLISIIIYAEISAFTYANIKLCEEKRMQTCFLEHKEYFSCLAPECYAKEKVVCLVEPCDSIVKKFWSIISFVKLVVLTIILIIFILKWKNSKDNKKRINILIVLGIITFLNLIIDFDLRGAVYSKDLPWLIKLFI